MKLNFNPRTLLTIAAMLAFSVAQAQSGTMDKPSYKAGKARISADYRADKAACASMAGNGKDVCIEEAKAKQDVARAELKYAYTAKPGDQTKVAQTKAESAYAVASQRCNDKAGNVKDVCVKEARAIEVKALVDAKMNQKIGEITTDGAAEKRSAEYKVAIEKCDAMAGDAKSSCIAGAKAKFGKS